MMRSRARIIAAAPPSTFSGLTSWLDGTDVTTMFSDAGGTVQVTNGQNIQRILNKGSIGGLGTGGASNAYLASGQSGTSEIQFTSTTGGTFTGGSSYANIITGSAYTIVAAIKTAATTGVDSSPRSNILTDSSSQYVIAGFSHPTQPGDLVASLSHIQGIGGYKTATAPNTVAPSTWCIYTGRYDGITLECRINHGAWGQIAAAPIGFLGNIPLLGLFQSAAATNGGATKHQCIYNVALSDNSLYAVEKYLAASCGVTLL